MRFWIIVSFVSATVVLAALIGWSHFRANSAEDEMGRPIPQDAVQDGVDRMRRGGTGVDPSDQRIVPTGYFHF